AAFAGTPSRNQFKVTVQGLVEAPQLAIEPPMVDLARNIRREKGASPTLNTTALVHEAYLKLVRQDQFENRLHFFRIAAQAMRQVVYNYAEQRNAQKRGGKQADASLEGLELPLSDERVEEILSLEAGLRHLEAKQSRLGQVVACRFFAGLSVVETAKALETSPATVKRDWQLAKAWLYRYLSDASV
ncbi:MAG: ECF-type sigma factor, partial [Bacteroidota bacterium]